VPGWELIPHATGPWLLRVGARLYVVPPERVGDLRAHGPPPALLTRPARRSRRAALWVRVPLLSSAHVRRIAERLSHLTRGRVLGVMAGVGCAGFVLAWRFGGAGLPALSPPGWVVALGLLGSTAVWHELGHAAALHRSGYPPGGIGTGLLFIIPVLYADVSAVSALARRDRLRVDLAGVCFQAGAGGALAAWGALADCGTCRLAGLLSMAAVIWSLIPFLRTDGYWVLCDLLGLRDLEGAGGAISRTYRIFNGVFMVGVGYLLMARLTRWSGWVLSSAPELRAGLLAACWVVLAWRLAVGLGADGRLHRRDP